MLSDEIIDAVYRARVTSSNALIATFASSHPKITIQKRLESLVKDKYLDIVNRIKDRRFKDYTAQFGMGKWYAIGPRGADYLKQSDLNNKSLTDESKFHLLMAATYGATLTMGHHKGLIKLNDYIPEKKGPSVWINEAQPPGYHSLRPDAEYTVNGQFRYAEMETGNNKSIRYLRGDEEEDFDLKRGDFTASSFWQKIVWYCAIHNQLVKDGKHPPFLVDVVTLSTNRINLLRKRCAEYNPKLNIFRFTKLDNVRINEPEVLLKEKYWFNITDKQNHAFIE